MDQKHHYKPSWTDPKDNKEIFQSARPKSADPRMQCTPTTTKVPRRAVRDRGIILEGGKLPTHANKIIKKRKPSSSSSAPAAKRRSKRRR